MKKGGHTHKSELVSLLRNLRKSILFLVKFVLLRRLEPKFKESKVLKIAEFFLHCEQGLKKSISIANNTQ